MSIIVLKNMVQYTRYVGIDMDLLLMFMLHRIKHELVEEIKCHKDTVCEKPKKTKNTMSSLKNQQDDKEKQAQKCKKDRQ